MTVGLLLNDLHNPWYAEVADGIHAIAERNGYQVILATGRRSPAVESRAVDAFLSSCVDGIIVAGCRMSQTRLAAVADEVPVVSAGRLLSIGLTTIDQPRNQMGRVAATMLLGSLTGDAPLEHIQMRPQLVVRTTTGPARSVSEPGPMNPD